MHLSLPLLLLAAIPLIALVTEAFYRLIERPSHRPSRMASADGRSGADLRAQREASPSEAAAVEQV